MSWTAGSTFDSEGRCHRHHPYIVLLSYCRSFPQARTDGKKEWLKTTGAWDETVIGRILTQCRTVAPAVSDVRLHGSAAPSEHRLHPLVWALGGRVSWWADQVIGVAGRPVPR